MESVWIFYAVTFIPVTLFGSIVFILFNLQNKLKNRCLYCMCVAKMGHITKSNLLK
jgi:hypothetical protein